MRIDGVINLDKPVGLVSARAVGKVKWLVRGLNKVGHAGTLDPFATGVLLILVGKATKACEQFMGLPKTYEAVVQLGATTPTEDPTSEPAPWPDARPASLQDVESVLPFFAGDILQRPPAFSALRIGGRRAYSIARAGGRPQLAPRKVHIDSIELLSYDWPNLAIRVRCGRGTYIRSLARDIGEKLNVGGYLTALRRTAVGRFDVASAVSLERVIEEGVERHLVATPDIFGVPSPSSGTAAKG
jgi:tRNA pseudouridine55 synthase